MPGKIVDDSLFFIYLFFSEKIRLDISHEMTSLIFGEKNKIFQNVVCWRCLALQGLEI